ncbi:MAG: pyruvate, phosphate dikinase [Bacillota bacterium]|jgi:pyruvate,orthophosphate dikinase|nr:pyruvate, phosphate dikinase [Bacillota bacterium]HOB91742.1 pyruvate, phosphate dikinase [Bacillota bacterium]HPZ54611.1 pyruvate, phosphate dikinase [Bacillota bacterium]HQD18981.1 pyruvate, phosphate dikinase [Bacillota bacterium]
MATKMVYFFGNGKAEGTAEMRNLLGGKGANLAEMTNMGIPVPAGFTITTEACTAYYANNEQWPEGLAEQVEENLKKLEDAMGAKFGDSENPLLLSVRSGARVSMPGMMDTVLNLGLNDTTVQGLIKKSNNPRFAYDCYRRFIQMYSDVVLGVPHSEFEAIMDEVKKSKGVELDSDLDADDLNELTRRFRDKVESALGRPFPLDVKEQLYGAINAVFSSWNNPRAITYRKIHGIPGDWGTAVNVQAMVFGNMGETSGTGVAFTRDPATGENKFYGEYLMNAQGEDVVAGIRTPQPIEVLEQEMPEIYAQLVEIYKKLEAHYKDMQDIEFTIQEGKLYMLQTRAGKRTATAAVRIAVEMVDEGLIDKRTAVTRVDASQLDQLLHPMIDPKAKVNVIAKGLPASPGAAVGKVVFTAQDAEEWAARGEKVILVRLETSPEDIGGMHVAQGILTARGGMTSHAAVVARGMGKCCVAGCGDVVINEEQRRFTVGDIVVNEGDYITLNGTTGEVILGEVDLIQPELSGDFGRLMEWADEIRVLKIRTNADTPHDAQVARDFGAEGIGLCRTEHMFFAEDRIKAVREMILAADEQGRRKALDKILPYQKNDFVEIFKVMRDLPVTIRLLDPPLHEFLPTEPGQIAGLAAEMGVAESVVRDKIASLQEFNPMLGFRGCRLGVVYPEIYEMQVRAIFMAACELAKQGYKIVPEVMIPLIGTIQEFEIIEEYCRKTAEQVMAEAGVKLEYSIGTMIEIPRATLIADKIAEKAEFFSFGTNDLTQMTFGYSRDDAGKFLPMYVEKNILAEDPFSTLDQEGVGQLVAIGTERGRSARPDLKIGICGEHGGDPRSVDFCHRVGLDYVSCSPFRVPIARLAAAQAQIANPR